MAGPSVNTMPEGLTKMLGLVSEMMAMPDADLDWLGQINVMVLQKIRQPFDQSQNVQQQQAGMGGAPSPDSMPPPQPQMPVAPAGPSTPDFGPANVPGGRNNPPMPNADELRRVLSANGPGGLG